METGVGDREGGTRREDRGAGRLAVTQTEDDNNKAKLLSRSYSPRGNLTYRAPKLLLVGGCLFFYLVFFFFFFFTDATIQANHPSIRQPQNKTYFGTYLYFLGTQHEKLHKLIVTSCLLVGLTCLMPSCPRKGFWRGPRSQELEKRETT